MTIEFNIWRHMGSMVILFHFMWPSIIQSNDKNLHVLYNMVYHVWLIGLMLSVSASHAVGRGFVSRPGHAKDYHKMVQTASLYCMHALG